MVVAVYLSGFINKFVLLVLVFNEFSLSFVGEWGLCTSCIVKNLNFYLNDTRGILDMTTIICDY